MVEEKTTEELEAEYSILLKEKVEIMRAEKEQRDKDLATIAEAAQEKAFQDKLDKALAEKVEAMGLTPKVETPEGTANVDVTSGLPGDEKLDKKPTGYITNPNTGEPGIRLFKEPTEYLSGYHKHFCESYQDALTGKKIADQKWIPYGAPGFLGDNVQGKFANQAFAADVITSWSPADIWCDLIWQAVKCKKALAGVVTLRACDINAGDGLAVQIRAIQNTMSIGSALNPCECSTNVSSIFTTYTITLQRYDLYKIICNLDLWDVGYVLRDAIIEAMAQDYALGLDGLVWTQLQLATPRYVETAGGSFTCNPGIPGNPRFSYSCCSYAANLYQSIINLESRMLSVGYGRHGFYLILGHRVANYLKYKEGMLVPPWMESVIKMDGTQLVGVGNRIKVIEYCGAQDCTDSYLFKTTYKTAPTMAYLIDPDRAVGEAYGKRPFLKTDEDPIECDQLKLVLRSYVGISKLSDGAIGVIRNP